MLRDVLLRLLYLRQKHGPGARIVMSRIDVKDALRQVPVDAEGATVIGYKVGNHMVVDLRLQFGGGVVQVVRDCFRQPLNTLTTTLHSSMLK